MPAPKSSIFDKKNLYTLFFMAILSLVCATILSILASSLKEPQEKAKDLDRSKQMLIAARILSPYGFFQVQNDKGEYVPALASNNGVLETSDSQVYPSQEQILAVYKNRIRAILVNDQGEEETFANAGINEPKYVSEYRKSGYYKEPLKLVYEILANPSGDQKKQQIEGYVIPVNGMGLWDAIYGYLAIKPDGDTVIGISWYDQKETPGLGANISEPEWQSQFPGKVIFQESADGKTDFKSAPLGIVVVKGKVKETLGDSPKSHSAVDGMAGATLTGNGVTNAYRDVLAKYRPFLMRLHEKTSRGEQ